MTKRRPQVDKDTGKNHGVQSLQDDGIFSFFDNIPEEQNKEQEGFIIQKYYINQDMD
jgi:hypothetical protein